MNNNVFFSLLLVVIFQLSFSQPHLEGNMEIDMKRGLISCDFKLSQLPNLKDYKVLLNKGMNIKFFKDNAANIVNYSGHYDAKTKGEAIEYSFLNQEKTLPEKFDISYVGAFPVYKDEYNAFDYKGIIAFTENTLRAAEQTKWYPVIYDVSNDKFINSYSYSLNISIINGDTVFINGTAPKKGNSLHFESKTAYPLLIFAGTYDFIERNGDFILNAEITPKNADDIFKNINVIKDHLSSSLDKKFEDKIYLINHKPLNNRGEGSTWGFNTYPSFAFTGLNFNQLVNNKAKFSNYNFKYFGHEFAHNYFSNNVMSGKLSWFWLESFPEYLSFTIARDICGESFFKTTLLSHIKRIKKDKFIPLDKITKKEDINQKYRYVVGPLILQCFEDNFGRNATNNTLKLLLDTASKKTLTLKDWKNSAVQSGISESDFNTFKEKFISSKKFKENVIKALTKNYG